MNHCYASSVILSWHWADGLKEKVTLGSLLFLSLSIASKLSTFPLNKVSPSEVPAILKKLFWKVDFEDRQFKTFFAARPCLCDIIPPDSKLVGTKTIYNWLSILHKVSKFFFFFSSNYPILWFWSLEHVCLIIMLLKSSHNLKWYWSHLDKISWTESRHETWPDCWVLLKMMAMIFEFWVPFGDDFDKLQNLHCLEAENSVGARA